MSCFWRVPKKQRIYHPKLQQAFSPTVHLTALDACSHMSSSLAQMLLKALKTDQFKQSPHIPGKNNLRTVLNTKKMLRFFIAYALSFCTEDHCSQPLNMHGIDSQLLWSDHKQPGNMCFTGYTYSIQGEQGKVIKSLAPTIFTVVSADNNDLTQLCLCISG